MEVDPAAAERATSDFHLRELRDGWRLTIRISDQLLAALRTATPGERLDEAAHFTVHVEPNLLPGEPFEVAVEVIGDCGAHGADDGAHSDRSGEKVIGPSVGVRSRPTRGRNAQ